MASIYQELSDWYDRSPRWAVIRVKNNKMEAELIFRDEAKAKQLHQEWQRALGHNDRAGIMQLVQSGHGCQGGQITVLYRPVGDDGITLSAVRRNRALPSPPRNYSWYTDDQSYLLVRDGEDD